MIRRRTVQMNYPIELPSLEEIKEMEMKRSQAIEALEICVHSVKWEKSSILLLKYEEINLALQSD